jgi:hypothetical protein
MKRLWDVARATLISPEVIAGLLPFVLLAYWPEPAVFFTEQFGGDIKWALGAATIPAGFFVATYQLGGDVISPHGKRRLILERPDYPMLKTRILLALVVCGFGFLLGLVGLYILGKYNLPIGTTLIVSGLLSSATSLATVGLAKWKIRELFRE